MAEWKTDTEEVKQIVKACRDFKKSLQEEKCTQFIKNLDGYARGICIKRKDIANQLQGTREELKKAKSNEDNAKVALRVLQGASILSCIWSPARIATTAAIVAAEAVLKFMKENTEKWEHNVRLLERMLEIYSNQAKASVELVNQAWESVKKMLHFYTDKHQEFIRRLKQASTAIDNEYNFPTPGVLMEYDFERPNFSYSPKKSVFNECLKDLREDFSASLYADLKGNINAFSHRDRAKASKERELDLAGADKESLTLAKKNCAKNIKEALEGFTKKIKESPNDLNAVNEAFNRLKTELERATDDERLKDLRENFTSLYADLCADLKDKIHHNALSNEELDRMIAFREQEFEKSLEDLMPSVLSVPSYNESLTLAKNHCVKNCKKALQDFTEKIKEAPNDSNAINEAFDNLETELEHATENLSQKIDPVLERNENYTQKALEYREFLESRKEDFIVDEKTPTLMRSDSMRCV
ncbi:5-methyltetrahydrofolate--homocysteine methyltransferase [Helicobacter pylori]|uniref:5-methyltetrahydrofolate--homocysteine methyltransferase n=1 Tax=Helicobacter pylori TaxID=210 RepID=UPI0026B4AF2E